MEGLVQRDKVNGTDVKPLTRAFRFYANLTSPIIEREVYNMRKIKDYLQWKKIQIGRKMWIWGISLMSPGFEKHRRLEKMRKIALKAIDVYADNPRVLGEIAIIQLAIIRIATEDTEYLKKKYNL